MKTSYDNLRERLATALERDARLHEAGQYERIGQGFLDFQSVLRLGGDERYRKLVVALNFWDAWILARNTDWLEHDSIDERSWARLAAMVAADLRADRNVSEPHVRARFDLASTLELPRKFGPARDASPLDDLNLDRDRD